MATTRLQAVVDLRHDPVSSFPFTPVLTESRKESSRTGWHCSKASFKIATLCLAAGISGTGHAVRDITATFWHGNGWQIRIFRKVERAYLPHPPPSAAFCDAWVSGNYKGMKDLSKKFVRYQEIDETAAGQRLGNFLMKTLKGVPQSHIYRIVRSGEVRVNGGRAQPSSHLAAGDVVRIPPLRLPERTETARPALPRGTRALPVLFEDDMLLAVDKSAGLAVHGGSGVSFGVIEQLRAQRPELRFLELVHRLDRETSGVLLLAKKRSALTALHAAWRDGAVDKRYDVLVRGRWPDAKRKVQVPLTRYLTAEGERRVRADDGGQTATTVFYRQRGWPNLEPPLSLLEAELHTGRTHQIRVHLTHLGYPLAGDDKYGDFAWNRALAKAGLRRMFLHARKLGFSHPASGEWLEIEAPLAEMLQMFLDRLPAARERDRENEEKDVNDS